jgi:hypothetical protein
MLLKFQKQADIITPRRGEKKRNIDNVRVGILIRLYFFLANNYSEVSPIWAMIVVFLETIMQTFMLHRLQLTGFYQTSNFRLALALISP